MNTPQETLEQIVSDAKALLGITDDTQDAVLNYHARAVIQKVLNYCHREDLPDALVLIIVEMLVRQYTAWKMEEPDAGGEGGGGASVGAEGIVGSMTLGDFSVSYDNSTEAGRAQNRRVEPGNSGHVFHSRNPLCAPGQKRQHCRGISGGEGHRRGRA